MTETTTRLDPGLIRLGAVIVVGSITAMLDMTMVAVALSDLSRAFGAPVTTVQWVGTAYLLVIATVIPVTGRLTERFGARTMWTFALTAFLAGSVLCGAAWSIGSLIAFRAVQGVGGGMIVPLSMMILAQAAAPEQRGRIMALVAIPGQVAPIAGPLVGGLIIDAAGWRWIFYVNVPVCLLALAMGRRGIPEAPRAGSGRLDVTGLALLAPALALVTYGLSARAPWLLAGGAALLAGFAAYALRVRDPLLNLRLFAHRPFAAASVMNFLSRSSIFGVMILMPLYFQQVRGYGALAAGLLLAPQSLGTMIALPCVGRLTDRFGARPVVLAGIFAGALAALACTRLGAHTGPLALGVVMLVWGMGVAAVAVPVSAAAYEGLDPAEIPGATSAITTVTTVGASAGGVVLSAILQGRSAGRPDAAAFAGTFWWVLGFMLVTFLPALFLPLGEPGKNPLPGR